MVKLKQQSIMGPVDVNPSAYGSSQQFHSRTTTWLVFLLWLCIVLCLAGSAGTFDQRPRFPHLNRHGMLPAVMGKHGALRPGADKTPQVAMPQKMGPPKNPKPPMAGRRMPPEQPRVRYDHVMSRNSEETRYKWAENQRAFFACPRGSFIAEISYRFDAAQSQLVKPFGWGASGTVYTIRDKFKKNLSPEKFTASFLRHPRSGDGNVKNADLFQNLVNPPVDQSPLTETGCDPVLFCLGHQACLFKVTVDLCAADPVPGKRKMFFVNVRCAKDTTVSTYMWRREESVLRNEIDQIMYMVHDDKTSNSQVAQIVLHTIPEDEVFGIDCPKASLALHHGILCKTTAG